MTTTRPKLLVFDLDATLWQTEMYLLSGPPFKHTKAPHIVLDRAGDAVEVMRGAILALRAVAKDERWKGVKIGIASRTDYPTWARTCIKMLRVPASDDEPADGDEPELLELEKLIDYSEIFDADKRNHFQSLHTESGIAFEDMAFFDNEFRNIRSVSKLGVRCFFTPDGMTEDEWTKFVKSIE